MEVLLPQRPCQVAFEAQYWSYSPARVFPARALVLSAPAQVAAGAFPDHRLAREENWQLRAISLI